MGDTVNVVVVGHVDHGKSTILGRLLYETKALPEGKLDYIKRKCEINGKSFEYAFFLDALKEEQSQGVTIEVARCFFKNQNKNFMFFDAPGHVEFIKNMVTGSAQADAALLVIDANEGVQENSIRHSYLLSLLNIKQVVVIINKIDLINYQKDKIEKIIKKISLFLSKMEINPIKCIPLSAVKGDNIVFSSLNTSWYKDEVLLDMLHKLKKIKLQEEAPFRMPVQDIYKFTSQGNKRIIAGTIESGKIKIGDKVMFFPSKSIAKITTIESFLSEKKEAKAGESIGITLDKPLFISRGNIVCKEDMPLEISNLIEVKLFWMDKTPLIENKKYLLKLCMDKTLFEVKEIKNVVDISTLKSKNVREVNQNEVAICVLQLSKNITFDLSTNLIRTARFVIIDQYRIKGGGIIIKNMKSYKK